jgi:spore coat polysaccharide biosynthesis protein SpsF
MGGSDPAGLTLQAVEAIDTLDGGFETVLVLGPGFSHHEELRSLLAKARRSYEVRRGVADMASLVAQADLAVASFGVTAYELAAVGVPAVLLCLSDDHAESAAGFDAEGIGLSLGVHAKVTKPMLAEAVEGMLLDASRRSVMALRAKQRVDGRGAERIAAVIARGECSMQSETPYIINGYVVRPETELEGSRCGYLANDKF